MESEIAYARSGVALAYQVMGEGDVDLVYVPDFMSNLVFAMRYPRWRRFYGSMATRFRLILFDKRGTGLSDHGGQFATLETRMEDMHAVRDAVGSARTVILASHEGCGMAALYAASYPERTKARVLFHPAAVGLAHQDPASAMAVLADLRERWGTRQMADEIIAADVASRVADAQCVRVSGDDYLEIYLSPEVADEVATFVAGERVPEVPETVLVTDIVGSTERATALGDAGWRDLLVRHNDAMRRAFTRFRGQERDTAGDGFFATFDGPARAIRCGQAIVAAVEALGLQVRIGIHIGECELHEDKVTGMAVIVGARIAAMAGAGQVLVSGTVRDLVAGSGLEFGERGYHQLKGLPGTWSIHEAR